MAVQIPDELSGKWRPYFYDTVIGYTKNNVSLDRAAKDDNRDTYNKKRVGFHRG